MEKVFLCIVVIIAIAILAAMLIWISAEGIVSSYDRWLDMKKRHREVLKPSRLAPPPESSVWKVPILAKPLIQPIEDCVLEDFRQLRKDKDDYMTLSYGSTEDVVITAKHWKIESCLLVSDITKYVYGKERKLVVDPKKVKYYAVVYETETD